MFRFLFFILWIGQSEDILKAQIEDYFQGNDILEDAFINDDLYQQELIFQAGVLLFEQNPLIEQMLAMAETIGDGTNEQMLLLMSEAENEIPDYAELQSPISDTKVFEQHQRPKIEQIVTDEPEWLAQTEFFLGALTVFIAFPLLLNSEGRKYKHHMILKDVIELKNENQLIILQGSTLTTEEYLIDCLTGIKVENAIRFYRKVEELVINNQGDRKWIERESEIQWYDDEDNEVQLSEWKSQIQNSQCFLLGYQLNDNQIEKLNNWQKLKLNPYHYPEYQIDQNNIYLVGNTTLRISYWYIPSQLLTVVCKSYGIQLNPIEIHIPILESTQGCSMSSTRQGCQELVCQKVYQWIVWNEWSQDEQNIDYVEEGLVSLEEIFESKLTFKQSDLNKIRLLAFLLMFLGIWMFFLPIYQVLSLFPMFGQLDIGPYLGGIVGFIFASVFWLITVGVSYCFYNKKVGLTLILIGISICMILIICTHFDYQIQPKSFLEIQQRWFS
ncbi:unnamed protein product [Paramecium primaurelia]|uniref:Uncharacterized protein n=1 Tax=Paramecium primaurelia TaxID=5886 RepID=A0A8S1NHV2_PARPR|nr:unnamed protein product [Paramecium primaurelia]